MNLHCKLAQPYNYIAINIFRWDGNVDPMKCEICCICCRSHSFHLAYLAISVSV
jgi:hypothetical protein